MTFHYICTGNAYMRKEPKSGSEIESEVFFSEQIEILKSHQDWTLIKTFDNCQGWIKSSSVFSRKTPFLQSSDTVLRVKQYHVAHIYETPDTIYGPILTVPFESRLKLIDDYSDRWLKIILPDDSTGFIQRGDVEFEPKTLSNLEMCKLSYNFLGLPYTWGGRSSFGYDCSGFTQMLYRQMNLHLPRNASEQILWDKFAETSEANLKAGDLIFFGSDQNKITHVGVYLLDNSFIHATVNENSPYIKISKLSDPHWNGKTRFRSLKTPLMT